MKVAHLLSNFTGGELSPRLNSRVDLKKYASGCRVLENFTIVPHGGARKRSGSLFVIRQRSDADDVVLIPYQYSTEQSYVLCFGPGYVWFFKDNGIITETPKAVTGITQANPAVVTSAAHGFVDGDTVLIQGVGGMTALNNRHFTVAGATTNTFQLAGLNATALPAFTSGGTAARIVTLTTDYLAEDLEDLQVTTGINDVMYIVHRNYPLRKLSRLSHTAWTLTEPTINTGPFRTINGDSTNRISIGQTSYAITGVSAAANAVVTIAAGHGFVVGDRVLIRDVVSSGGPPEPPGGGSGYEPGGTGGPY
jgi:hypothetical protein